MKKQEETLAPVENASTRLLAIYRENKEGLTPIEALAFYEKTPFYTTVKDFHTLLRTHVKNGDIYQHDPTNDKYRLTRPNFDYVIYKAKQP